ncbi:hypothetical protein X975_05177, partial [Stegodyphus mimosarum]
MGLSQVFVLLTLGLSTCLATYGPHLKNNHGPPQNVHLDSPRIHLDSPKIHLNSPKILLDGPKIIDGGNGGHIHGSLLDEEPIILDSDKPLYIRKSLHGIHSAGPILLGAGGYGGKALDLGGHDHSVGVIGHASLLGHASVVKQAPVVHDQPILIRRPVLVSRELTATQDHLEKLHFANVGLNHGYLGAHAGLVPAFPLAKGLHEKTVIYHQAAPFHAYGHGVVGVPAYSAPLILSQPNILYGGHGHISFASGKQAQGGGHGKY